MPRVVVIGATLECSHGGRRQLLAGDPRLAVAGSGVVTAGMEAGQTFAPAAPGVLVPCPVVTPSSAPSPCTTLVAASGLATTLAVGGTPVLLDTAGGAAVNPQSPGSTWKVADPGQAALEAR